MNKVILILGLLGISLNVSAFTVGIFDYQKIFEHSKEGQKINKLLEEEVKRGEDRLRKMYKEVVELRETYEKQKDILSEEGKKRKQDEFLEKTEEFQYEQAVLEQSLAKMEVDLKEPLSNKINEIVKGLSDKMNLTLTVSIQENPFKTIKKQVDITNLIITDLDQNSKK